MAVGKQTCETMTLNLPQREMRALDAIAREQDLPKTMVMRQALRMYQLIHERMRAGETVSFSGDVQRAVKFVGIGLGAPPHD